MVKTRYTDNEVMFIIHDFDALQCIIDALVDERLDLCIRRTEIVAHWEAHTYQVLSKLDRRFLQTFDYELADIDSDIAKFTALQYESAQ